MNFSDPTAFSEDLSFSSESQESLQKSLRDGRNALGVEHDSQVLELLVRHNILMDTVLQVEGIMREVKRKKAEEKRAKNDGKVIPQFVIDWYSTKPHEKHSTIDNDVVELQKIHAFFKTMEKSAVRNIVLTKTLLGCPDIPAAMEAILNSMMPFVKGLRGYLNKGPKLYSLHSKPTIMEPSSLEADKLLSVKKILKCPNQCGEFFTTPALLKYHTLHCGEHNITPQIVVKTILDNIINDVVLFCERKLGGSSFVEPMPVDETKAEMKDEGVEEMEEEKEEEEEAESDFEITFEPEVLAPRAPLFGSSPSMVSDPFFDPSRQFTAATEERKRSNVVPGRSQPHYEPVASSGKAPGVRRMSEKSKPKIETLKRHSEPPFSPSSAKKSKKASPKQQQQKKKKSSGGGGSSGGSASPHPLVNTATDDLPNHIKNRYKIPDSLLVDKVCFMSGCGKKYTTVSSLRGHLRGVHDAYDTQFKCQKCGKNNADKIMLSRHSASHTGVFPFNCDFCGRGFITNAERKKHELSCTNM